MFLLPVGPLLSKTNKISTATTQKIRGLNKRLASGFPALAATSRQHMTGHDGGGFALRFLE